MKPELLLWLPTVICIVIAFGVVEYFGRRIRDIEGYYVANRAVNPLLLTGTYVASWVSITGMVGMSGSAYRQGIAWNQWTWGFWGVVFFTFLVGLPLRKLSRYSHELADPASGQVEAGALLTPPDFFQMRFPSKWVRGISAIMLVCGLTFYAVGQLMGMSIALTNLGLNYYVGLLLLSAVIIYTTVRAGTPGVIVNDTINMFTFILAVAVLVPFALKAVGGIDNMVAISSQARPGIWSNLGYKNTVLGLISYNLVWNFMTAGSPHLVQRAYTARDEKTFLKSQVVGVLVVILWTWFLYTGTNTGLVLFPDLKGTASDNILPMVAIKTMPAILAGIVLAGIFAVGFSTINTQISVLAFSLSRDVYQTLINPKVQEARMLKLTKWFIALLTLIIAFFGWIRPGFIYEVTSWGIAFYGAAFVPMFVFGLFWKRANTAGMLAGMVLSSLTYIVFGLLKLTGVYVLPGGVHPFLISLPVSILSIVLVSLFVGQSEKEKFVAQRVSEILSKRSDEVVTVKDYVVPVAVLILAIVFGIVLNSMYA